MRRYLRLLLCDLRHRLIACSSCIFVVLLGGAQAFPYQEGEGERLAEQQVPVQKALLPCARSLASLFQKVWKLPELN